MISECVSTCGGFVLINRILDGFIPAACDLRQGDHLPVYLFNLAEEILSPNISAFPTKGKFTGSAPQIFRFVVAFSALMTSWFLCRLNGEVARFFKDLLNSYEVAFESIF